MSYTVAPASLPRDRRDLLALWARNYSDVPESRYDWLHGQHATTRSWLLRTSDGDLVGAAALADRNVHLRQGVVPMAQAIDLVIDRNHRTFGPAVHLQRTVAGALAASGLSLAYAFPNRASEMVLMRAGYRKIGALQRWTRILRYERALRKWLPGAVGRACGAALSAVDRTLAAERWYRLPAGSHIERRHDFDKSFDALWQRAVANFEWIGDRGAEYLRWRFGQHPTRSYTTFALVDAHRTLLGYIVSYEKDSTVHVADTLAVDMSSWKTLISCFLQRLRSTTVTSVTLLHFGLPAFEQMLGDLGFRPRGVDTSILVCPAQLSDKEFPDPSLWYLTEADRDI
jgi:hypothetical protein